jgi:flagellar biosynthesis protein FlhG
MNAIRSLDFSFVILDLGAGTSHYTLDAFNSANVGILSVLPEPTSIENAYRFLKASYFRRIEQDPSLAAIQDLVHSAMTPHHPGGIQSPTDLMNEVRRRNPGSHAQLMQSISEFRPKLVLNQTRTQNDVDVGFSMKSVAKKYFGIELDYLGYLEYEPNVWQSVRRMRPILADYPHSRIAAHVERICHYLLKQARTTQAGWNAP